MGNRTFAGIGLLMTIGLLVSCWKAPLHDRLSIEVPEGYSGAVMVQLGIAGAPALPKKGDTYVIAVPPDGKVSTSTSLSDLQPDFKNVPGNRLWGYTSQVLKTGDGIPVGGSIQFFVGTDEQYQMEVARKRKSHIIERSFEKLLASLHGSSAPGA